MLSYCLKGRKITESINPKVSKTTNGKTMILSKCAIGGSNQNFNNQNQNLLKSNKQKDY